MLDPRLIALQGLGVPLTPIAIAVQGLIAQLQEEAAQRLEYQGGGGRRSSRPVDARPAQIQARRELTEDEVRAQWELLELRQRNQAERTATAAPSTATAVPAPPPLAIATPAPTAEQLALAATLVRKPKPVAQQSDDELALLLLLSEV